MAGQPDHNMQDEIYRLTINKYFWHFYASLFDLCERIIKDGLLLFIRPGFASDVIVDGEKITNY